MDAINRLNTDVNSIKNTRSGIAALMSFKRIGYKKVLDPGIYDIHLPICRPCSEIEDKLNGFLEYIDVENLVVDPGCCLELTFFPENISALQNMVEATSNVRAPLGVVN